MPLDFIVQNDTDMSEVQSSIDEFVHSVKKAMEKFKKFSAH